MTSLLYQAPINGQKVAAISTVQMSSSFPFFILPPEIRLQVYKELFKDLEELHINHPLRNVSKEIHNEVTHELLQHFDMVIYYRPFTSGHAVEIGKSLDMWTNPTILIWAKFTVSRLAQYCDRFNEISVHMTSTNCYAGVRFFSGQIAHSSGLLYNPPTRHPNIMYEHILNDQPRFLLLVRFPSKTAIYVIMECMASYARSCLAWDRIIRQQNEKHHLGDTNTTVD